MFTSPDRVSFRYRLLGDDGHWQDVGNRRTAYFTNLDPGSYRFEVSATNEDGVEAHAVAKVEFRIRPALYQTWWFKVICTFVIGAACLLLGRLQLKRSTRKVRVLIDERHAERERIARDLHDTLLQDFQGISLHLQAWSGNPDVPADVREQVARTAVSAVESLKRGREKILFLRSGDGEQLPLIEAIERVAKNILEAGSTQFELHAERVPRILTDAAYEETVAIVRECLRNGANHASATQIEVRIRFGRRSLTVTVADNGSGIANPAASQSGVGEHWGLVGISERARLIGARFHLRSSPMGGSAAVLDVPARRAYAKR
jgi:signal transduction histidine kinase